MSDLPAHRWVRDAADLLALAEALEGAPWVALDSESNSMFVYRERVCLLQLNVGGTLWLVDTLALGPAAPTPGTADEAHAEALAASLAPLAEPLANPGLRVWIHGGSYDVACLKRDYAIEIAGLFDTQQAASFLGWSRTGYAAVVEEVCGVSLAKAHSQYDWGQRPLHDEALRYALDDVIHLPEVGEALVSHIAEADLEEELEIANQSVSEADAHQNAFDPARMWKLKGIRALPRERLPVLTALYAWRDRKGRELDRPPGRLIANDLLLHVARRAPRDAAALGRLRLRRKLIQEHGEELVETIAAALREPPAPPPKPQRPRPSNAELARTKALQAWRREEAERRELPHHAVLPKRALEWLAANGAHDLQACPELGDKRIARYGGALSKCCAAGASASD